MSNDRDDGGRSHTRTAVNPAATLRTPSPLLATALTCMILLQSAGLLCAVLIMLARTAKFLVCYTRATRAQTATATLGLFR